MNVALRQRMSLADFLAWEERQEQRYDRGTTCRAFGSDLKVEVAGSTRHPDAFVSWTESVQRYVMLEQDIQAATVFARENDRWIGSLLAGDAVLALPEIGIEMPLAELYDGLDLAQPLDEASA